MSSELPEFRMHGFDDKYSPLTATGLHPSKHNQQYIRFLSSWLAKPLAGLRILDLGCGRGDLVGQLRARGVRAFGVEVDERLVECGRILNQLYTDEMPLLSILDKHGRSIFPDEYFDVVVSDQVLEHVSDLGAVASEVVRVLKVNGQTAHQFPARFRFIEPHYGLPLVHWLPKGPIRQAAIRVLLRLGFAGRFFPDYSVSDRAEIIYAYSVEHTFYRSVAEVTLAFELRGIQPSFQAGMVALLQAKLGRRYAFAAPVVAGLRTVMFTGTKLPVNHRDARPSDVTEVYDGCTTRNRLRFNELTPKVNPE